jgi:hypothetical protein
VGVFTVRHSPNKVWYGTFSHFDKLGIRHGVSSRLHGASSAPFFSLNLGLHTGDDAKSVIINRRLFCQAVGVEFDNVVTADQVHGAQVAVITEADAGKGVQCYDNALRGTDALITNIADIPLMLFFADCVPVLIVDPVRKAVGISHAGWKGTVAKIAQKTVLTMQEQYGTKPSDCLIGIAPSIGLCCYEINDVVLDKLKEQFTYWEQLIVPHGERYRLDLWQANVMQLTEIGIASNNITVSNVCTACNKEMFFSYRAEGGCTGRIGAVISL